MMTDAAGGRASSATTPEAPHPKVLQLIEHWRELTPAPGMLPGRQHFDPMRVPKLLPNIWLLDVVPGKPRRFRYRLIGTRLVDAGIPGRKGDFLDDPRFMSDPGVGTRLFESVCDGREPNWSRGKPLLRHSTYVDIIERVSLPLAADGQTVDMIMNLTLFYWDDGSIR